MERHFYSNRESFVLEQWSLCRIVELPEIGSQGAGTAMWNNWEYFNFPLLSFASSSLRLHRVAFT